MKEIDLQVAAGAKEDKTQGKKGKCRWRSVRSGGDEGDEVTEWRRTGRNVSERREEYRVCVNAILLGTGRMN
jgi:hypothetical protein